MGRAADGTYSAPSNSFNPAVEGEEIDEGDWNEMLEDLSSEITDSVSRSGKGSVNAFIAFDETTTPTTPASNVAQLYIKDVGGTSSLHLQDSAGTETNLMNAALADNAVTFAKMQNIATNSLIGRDTTGTGDPENILLDDTLEMDGSGNLLRAALTGDVTASAGSNSTTIANDAVTNAKMANMAESTIKGRAAGAGTGDPTDLTATQATAILNVFGGDAGSGGLKGLVPATVSGDAAKVLYGDGTFKTPPGASGGEANTASNVGTAGVGVFKQKSSIDLQFKKINAGSGGKVTITDDTANDEIDIQVVDASATQAGAVELATDAEVQTGTDTVRAVTPAGLRACTATDTRIGVVELATDAETQTGSDTSRAVTPANLTAAGIKQGKHSVYIPATAMVARTTNGAAPGTAETSTNKQMVKTLDFDTTTQEFVQFSIRMPKSWNESTISFAPVWSHASTTTNFGVVWALEAVAISNDDALDASWGTAGTSTDTGGTTNDLYEGPESSAITIAGTPAEGDTVYFQVKRVPSDGSDTMAIDARLHGIMLYITYNAATDA